MDMSFFNKVIQLVFWAITAGGFIYGVVSGMNLAKAIKHRASADQEEATYGIGVAIVICLIGLGGATFFPAIPTF